MVIIFGQTQPLADTRKEVKTAPEDTQVWKEIQRTKKAKGTVASTKGAKVISNTLWNRDPKHVHPKGPALTFMIVVLFEMKYMTVNTGAWSFHLHLTRTWDVHTTGIVNIESIKGKPCALKITYITNALDYRLFCLNDRSADDDETVLKPLTKKTKSLTIHIRSVTFDMFDMLSIISPYPLLNWHAKRAGSIMVHIFAPTLLDERDRYHCAICLSITTIRNLH